MSENKHDSELLSNPYGETAYETFRGLEKAYVDKSLFIKELDGKNSPRYPVLLRPRRFGKSTFVQMLKCFYDISYKDRYEEIFSGTDIYEENLESHNSYHVIDFDFSGVSGKNEDTLANGCVSAISFGLSNFLGRYPDFVFNPSVSDRETPSAFIKYFFNAYNSYHSKKSLYVMIDEYDNFANSVLSKDLDLFQAITSAGGFLKDFYAAVKEGAKNIVAKTFISGVSSVSLDSLTSGFNIALNVTSDACFNEYAGFTEEELAKLIPQLVDTEKLGANVGEIIARMKPVYDGYCFSPEAERTVFNSSMTLYYLRTVQKKGRFLAPEKCLDPASDHDGDKLKQLFEIAEDGLADEIIDGYLNGDEFFVENLAENINLNKSAKYDRDRLLSMLYYLGYLTIDPKLSSDDMVALKVPNLFMSKLFAECAAEFRLRASQAFCGYELDISALKDAKDDISSFAASCTEFLSRMCTNQVLSHMSEMAINLALYTKLSSIRGVFAEMQKSLRIAGDGERFADLVVTVNKGKSNECFYLFELKYLPKTNSSDHRLQNLMEDASAQALRYKSSIDFSNKNVKAYAMVFVGTECMHYKCI